MVLKTTIRKNIGYVFSNNKYYLSKRVIESTNNTQQNLMLVGIFSNGISSGEYDVRTIKTMIPGLGLRIYWPTSGSSGSAITNYFPFSRECLTPCNISEEVVVELVKMSGIRTGKITKGTEVATVEIKGRDDNVKFMKIILGEDLESKAASCYVKDDAFIDLGDHSIDDLRNDKFNTSGEKFQLEILCDQDASIDVYYQGGFGKTGKLENKGTAKSVAIKLMNERNALVPTKPTGNPITVNGGESYFLNLKAAIDVESKSMLSVGTITADTFIILEVK